MFEKVVQKDKDIYIRGIIDWKFLRDLETKYQTPKIAELFRGEVFGWVGNYVKIHYFFGPELLHISQQLYDETKRPKYAKFNELLRANTWVGNIYKMDFPSEVNLSLLSDLSFTLKPYQLDFLKSYTTDKKRLELDGFILAYEQGLGKTFTSIALMHCMKKDLVIIIAPKSSIRNVWKNEINVVYKDKPEIYVTGDKFEGKPRYLIFNYEAINKVKDIISKIPHKNLGIIVDESHNFKTYGNKRVSELIDLKLKTGCKDVLLMSGTPIKALGGELIPALYLLDPKFDGEALGIFKKVFGVNVPVAMGIVKHRLGMMMLRKLKSEVLSLPEKKYHSLKITIPSGNKYTLSHVKGEMQIYLSERLMFYMKDYKKYKNRFKEIIAQFEKENKGDYNEDEMKRYLKLVWFLEQAGRHGVHQISEDDRYFIKTFETVVIEPRLESSVRKEFRHIKSIVKYVFLKAFGEVLGKLQQMRRDMFAEIIVSAKPIVSQIIKDAEKKTVLFTTFVDVLKMAEKEMKSSGFNPITVYGENVKDRDKILVDFKLQLDKNPLIATIQTLSTAVTLVEANTVIFINTPWRYVDRAQAEDRVHRIGQDTEVNIYTIILQTGGEANLSTRLEDIVKWSEEMFDAIVGGTNEKDKDEVRNMVRMKLTMR